MTDKTSHILANLKEVTDLELPTTQTEALFDAVVLQTQFDPRDIGAKSIISSSNNYIQQTQELIEACCERVKDGGLIFIYGLPNYLSFFGEFLSDQMPGDYSYLFKYWIACEFGSVEKDNELPTSHLGLLMYLKTKSKKNPTPFFLNTKFVRIPYSDCAACGKTTKDWGGKKHLINPLGSAISDVWSFFETPISTCNAIPAVMMERILALLSDGKSVLKVNQTSDIANFDLDTIQSEYQNEVPCIAQQNQVVHKDCIGFLTELKNNNPSGVFDLAFADPPYNLAKKYSTYQDDQEDKKYIEWCNEWLLGMYNNLKPGGALLVLNIPKWSIHHFNFLADKMVFQNWIVWDALSTPAGKLLPAHYSLLYFTKPGAIPKLNLNDDKNIDSREYCLRGSCVSKRKNNGNLNTEHLTDIWKDVHRIKHKKDRDHHPCQLPTKLMERIIKLFTNEGDLIFDPFGGAGTTAVAAKLLKRSYVITELDIHYVEISKRNIEKVKEDAFGNRLYKRESVAKNNSNGIPRKRIEKEYMKLCFDKNKVLTMEELKDIDPSKYELVQQYQGIFSKLQGATRRKMEVHNLFS
jgi:DNA modification methylase